MHTHIIYYATYKNNIVYIGSGLPSRHKHCTSGTSHIYDLNRLHFLEPNSIQVHILKGFTSQEEALEEEKKLILEFKPVYNTQYLENSPERLEINKEEIKKYAEDFIPIKNEIALRKALTPYERIEQGLEPSVEHAIQWYEDPKTDNEVLFKVFPLFNEWLNAGITPAMMKTNRLNRELISQKAIQHRTLLCNSSEVKAQMKLKIGSVYTREELLKKVIEIYKSLGLPTDKAKATDIKKWYEIKAYSKKVKGIQQSAYKIIKEI